MPLATGATNLQIAMLITYTSLPADHGVYAYECLDAPMII